MQHPDNRLGITKKLVSGLEATAPPLRAVRFLRAVANLCDNESQSQETFAKSGGVSNMIAWTKVANATEEVVQAPAAKAILAVVGNNTYTQSLTGKLGGVPPLVELVQDSSLEAKENAACALWHLATLPENRSRIFKAKAIPPLVKLLRIANGSCPQLAAMTLLRLAEGSSKAAANIAKAGGIRPLVSLLIHGTAAAQQVAAAALAAISLVARNRDLVVNAGAVEPMVKLLGDKTLGTPETAARALAHLSWVDSSETEVKEVEEVDGIDDASQPMDNLAADTVSAPHNRREDRTLVAEDPLAIEEPDDDQDDEQLVISISGVEQRRACIKQAGGIRMLVSMLDGSNLNPTEPLKPGTTGGWAAVGVGIQGCIEVPELFAGSRASFGARIGMQEQAVATISTLASGSQAMQDTLVQEHAVPPLLSLIRDGGQIAQEHAAYTMWSLTISGDNQKVLVEYPTFVGDLVVLLKSGSTQAQYFTAAALAALTDGSVKAQRAIRSWKHGGLLSGLSRPRRTSQRGSLDNSEAPGLAAMQSKTKADATGDSKSYDGSKGGDESKYGDALEGGDEPKGEDNVDVPVSESSPDSAAGGQAARRGHVLLAIFDAGGIPPLVKLCEHGSPEGKEKAAACLWHLAVEPPLQTSIAASGGIKPLVSLLADGTEAGLKYASEALTRLAFENEENQAQIAKRLVSMLDHNDPQVVSRAAHDLQSLAQSHPKAPIVIVSAGAISPLVSVLSNGKTEEGRNEASRTLYTLANSGEANQTAIAIGLVALLGVGTELAQECVTELLLTLSSGDDSDLANRRAIANAGPFKMLVQQLHSANARVCMLAAAVMSRLSGDSAESTEIIVACGGIEPLVALLDLDGSELGMQSQLYSTMVLADMTTCNQEHAISVTTFRGTDKLIAILRSAQTVNCKARAACVLGNISLDPLRAKDVGDLDATEPLIELLKTDNRPAQQQAAFALAGMAAGGKENQDRSKAAAGIDTLVKLLKQVLPTESNEGTTPDESIDLRVQVQVQSNVARALAELARDNEVNQHAIAKAGGIIPLISLVNRGPTERPQEEAARALWCLSSKNPENQSEISAAGGIESLVALVGRSTARGQEQAAGAFHSLALNHDENQVHISQLLVQLLRDSTALNDSQEKAARAISRFARADLVHATDDNAPDIPRRRNQDSLAAAECIGLTVALLQPELHVPQNTLRGSTSMKRVSIGDTEGAKVNVHRSFKLKRSSTDTEGATDGSKLDLVTSFRRTLTAGSVTTDSEGVKVDTVEENKGLLLEGQHRLTQKELCSALWSLSELNETNQRLIASEGGIPLLIALLTDHPEIHCDAAGALWSLASETMNQSLIAESGGIPKLVALLKPAAINASARETATGALHRLAANADNRNLIAEDDGINLLIPLFDGGSAKTKEHVTAALLALSVENPSNQFFIVLDLVRMLSEDAQDDSLPTSALQLRVKAQTHATQVLYKMSLDRDNREAFSRTSSVLQLVRQLRMGSDEAQGMSSDALTNVARMSTDLRVQVTGQLVSLLSSNDSGVRQRAGTTLRNNNAEGGVGKTQLRQVAISNGVAPLVDLLKAGLNDGRLEAQEYALRSLSMINDGSRRRNMVEGGCIPAVTRSLRSGQLSADSQDHGLMVLAFLAVDRDNHSEIISERGITPLVEALSAEDALSTNAKRHAATALAYLAADDAERQILIADAISPLVKWLMQTDDGEKASLMPTAAQSLAAICRGNPDLQRRVAQGKAIVPMVNMLKQSSSPDAHEAASASLATLAVESPSNQREIAQAGAIPMLIDLIHSAKPKICENASFALAMLSDFVDNRVVIANSGGFEPLVKLLITGNDAAKQCAARAVSLLALDNADHQLALVHAAMPLADLLGSDLIETQDWAQIALLRLATNPTNRAIIVKPLVDVLSDRNTSAQLKAAECLAMLLERCPVARSSIAKAGAITPLVQLLGNGQRADLHTPPERAAAVLSELVRLADSKVEVVRVGGLQPLVVMLSSPCAESQAHAACAIWHLSVVAEHKPMLIALLSIQPLVALLTNGTAHAQKCAARTLWQLSSLSDAKALIVRTNGISSLIMCLDRSWEAQLASSPAAAVEEGKVLRSGHVSTNEAPQAKPFVQEAATALDEQAATGEGPHAASSVQEAAAAILSELVRTQSSNRALVVAASGLPLLMEIICVAPMSSLLLQHVTRAIRGLSQERPYRVKIARYEGLIRKLVELLLSATGETQKLAAATLVTLAQDEFARINIAGVISGEELKGYDTLQMLKFVPDSWLRSQVEELMAVVGVSDGAEKSKSPLPLVPEGSKFQAFSPRIQHNPSPLIDYCAPIVPMPMSPRVFGGAAGGRLSVNTGAGEVLLARFQARLEANPDLWMVKRQKEEMTDLHMADLAVHFKVADKVVIETCLAGLRRAVVRYIGKAPEIAPGFWIGVEFDNPDGKNDGSVGGTRYFRCKVDHGSFLRPNRLKHETGSSSQFTRVLADAKVADQQEALNRQAGAVATTAAQPMGCTAPEIDPSAQAKAKAAIKEKPKLKLKSDIGPKEQRQRAPTARLGSQRAPEDSYRPIPNDRSTPPQGRARGKLGIEQKGGRSKKSSHTL